MDRANGVLTESARWVQDLQKFESLQAKYVEKSEEIKALADAISAILQSMSSYSPKLGEATKNSSKKVNPDDGRAFFISTGRAIKDSKRAGKTRAEAKALAMDRLQKLATNHIYNLAKPPQAAIDRIELQLVEHYGEAKTKHAKV